MWRLQEREVMSMPVYKDEKRNTWFCKCNYKDMEYEETLNKARSKFCVYERRYGEEKYWSDPEYLFDWTDGEFM